MTEINTFHSALCAKMRTEFLQYKADLLDKSKEEILNHSWEYATLADIMQAVENTQYTDLEMKALLESEHPLMDVYKEWSSLETDVMEQLGHCVMNVANAAWRDSYKASVACKEAIEDAISEHYRDNRLHNACVEQVVSKFGYDRVFLVLATTVRFKDHDARISSENKEWAESYPVYTAQDFTGLDRTRFYIVDKVNPGLVDIFLWMTRKAHFEAIQKLK